MKINHQYEEYKNVQGNLTAKIKTLVIHPEDPSTDFLKPIYYNNQWTEYTKPASLLYEKIMAHDRIIMLGHGTEEGLYNTSELGALFTVCDHYGDLLRSKDCVFIWCNADKFVERNNLTGFYTGMIISEKAEAMLFKIQATSAQLEESNNLFALAMKESIGAEDKVSKALSIYRSERNPVIVFNRVRIYKK